MYFISLRSVPNITSEKSLDDNKNKYSNLISKFKPVNSKLRKFVWLSGLNQNKVVCLQPSVAKRSN